MRALSVFELLRVWERGLTQTPAQRALTLLAAACPDTQPDALARLSVGQRDARLLTLREWTFGPQLVSLAACPACGERLELTFDVAEIRVASEVEPVEALSLSLDDHEVRFRLPNSLDLAAIAGHEDAVEARRLLLERCLLTTQHNGEETPGDQLPSNVLEAVVERMAQADPQADVQLALACPECGHEWQVALDIVAFFWSEISVWAYRTLHEVHVLASAYGWREADILAMSPWRRGFYLSLQNGSRKY
jgi:hypothetical protein